MSLTADQVLALAPDPASAAAGRKLAAANHWKNTGQDDQALWGECQGSALYQTRVDKANWGSKCSCPSRKFPCKHVLGLLLLNSGSPAAIPAGGGQPQWVSEWLGKRQERAEKQAEKQAAAETPEAKAADEKAKNKRADARQTKILAGLDRLEQWLEDQVRLGFSQLASQGVAPWEQEARRLVDAQAPALAGAVRRLGEIRTDTPAGSVVQLTAAGRLLLLIDAYRKLDQWDAPFAWDIKQAIGWTFPQEELATQGTKMADTWYTLGQRIDDTDRVQVQRNWWLGQGTHQPALILQFAVGNQGFAPTVAPGFQFTGELNFFPSAALNRAKPVADPTEVTPIPTVPHGHKDWESFLADVADKLACNPWQSHFLCVLHSATLVQLESDWGIRDALGQTLPVKLSEPYQLLARTAGAPFCFIGEYSQHELLPMSMFYADQWFPLS